MEHNITDELIDFFANADIQNNTLALALLEPLKRRTHNPLEADVKKIFENITGNEEVKDVETMDSKAYGDEAFLRDHNLLPKLIIHPNMTLAKILKVYPNLPYPKYFNTNAKLKILLGEWLPYLSKYSREYLIETDDTEIQELVKNILKMVTDKNPKKKKKVKKDQTVPLLDMSKDSCSNN